MDKCVRCGADSAEGVIYCVPCLLERNEYRRNHSAEMDRIRAKYEAAAWEEVKRYRKSLAEWKEEAEKEHS